MGGFWVRVKGIIKGERRRKRSTKKERNYMMKDKEQEAYVENWGGIFKKAEK